MQILRWLKKRKARWIDEDRGEDSSRRLFSS